MDIKTNLSPGVAKKILGNSGKAIVFLSELRKIKQFDLLIKMPKSGKNKGKEVPNLKADEIWSKISENWDFEAGQKIMRKLFKTTEKYKLGKKAYATMNRLFEEWSRLNFGEIKWSVSQGEFDRFVQMVNAKKMPRTDKDKQVKLEAVKYRRIKEIKTVRHDFIENLIFEKKENVLPTLIHNAKFDYFINGIPFDQKVANSPTKEFKADFGENWRSYALEHPEKVAEYLYEHQNKSRFGDENRLLVVYLDENVSFERIEEIIQETELEKPLEIKFKFAQKNAPATEHHASCFVVLLYNI